MKILVTGCYGFIGFNFLQKLIKEHKDEFEVTGIDLLNNSYSKLNYQQLNTGENFEFLSENIIDINKINSNKRLFQV